MERLVLFDIDGTLVLGGPAKTAFTDALLSVFGTTGPIETHSFGGKTDGQIARELMVAAGIEPEEVDRGLPDLYDHYLDGLEAGLASQPMNLLPGAAELVEKLAAREDVALGLVTGNHQRGAWLKLGSVHLDHWFEVGGFGSDHEERNHLPGIAVDRADRHWGIRFAPEQVVVVGDTPADVECGQWFGARTVAVCTGHFDQPTLEATGPDAVLADFTEVAEVAELLLDVTESR